MHQAEDLYVMYERAIEMEGEPGQEVIRGRLQSSAFYHKYKAKDSYVMYERERGKGGEDQGQ